MSIKREVTNEKFLNTLDSISFMNPKERLNSPRSLEALGFLGIDQHKLYYISFEDYLYTHPEFKNLTQALKERRYKHYETKRKEKIELAKNKRNELNEINKSKMSKSKSVTNYTQDPSTVIQQEREKLNTLKKQQICELRNMIEFEFKMEEIRKKNEVKMQLIEQKDEELNQLRKKQAKERETKNKLQEYKKEQKQQAEMAELERKNKEREEEELKGMLEETSRQEAIEKERQRRVMESKKRHEEFQEKIDNILMAQQRELQERQNELLRKENQRKTNLEEIKKEQYKSSLIKQKKKQEKIEKVLFRNESAFVGKQSDYEKKQQMAEEIRKKFADERIEKQKHDKLVQKQKEQEIIQILKRNDLILEKRVEVYNKKQSEIEERQKERDKLINMQMKEKHRQLIEKEQKTINTRRRNESLIEDNRKRILERMNCHDGKIRQQKEDNYKASLERFVEESMRKEDIEDNIRQKEKSLEFIRLQRIEELEEKNRRVEEMKLQKMFLIEEKKRMNREMQKSKEKMLDKFASIRKSNKYNDKNEIFNELFDETGENTHDLKKSRTKRNSINNPQPSSDYMTQREKGIQLQNNPHGDFQFLTNINSNGNNKQTLGEIVGNDDNPQSKIKSKPNPQKEDKIFKYDDQEDNNQEAIPTNKENIEENIVA